LKPWNLDLINLKVSAFSFPARSQLPAGGMPDREAGVTKIKFKGVGDVTEQVTPDELRKIADEMESCTKRLRDLFWSFGDYHQWLIKRMPSI
jgi:hypothetical protein